MALPARWLLAAAFVAGVSPGLPLARGEEEDRTGVTLPGGLRLPCRVLGGEGPFLVVEVGGTSYRLEAANVTVEGRARTPESEPAPAAPTFLDRAVARARVDLSLAPAEETTLRRALGRLLQTLQAGEDPSAAKAAFEADVGAALGEERSARVADWLGWVGVR